MYNVYRFLTICFAVLAWKSKHDVCEKYEKEIDRPNFLTRCINLWIFHEYFKYLEGGGPTWSLPQTLNWNE